MVKIGIIIGSTRPGRNGLQVGEWVFSIAQERGDAQFELVDIESFNLPVLDEPLPAAAGKYSKAHTKCWAAQINGLDGFVFVTPEYNHGMPGALKNALDYLYKEWSNKAVGFVSYGASAGGTRSVEQFRSIMGVLHMADVSAQVSLSLREDFAVVEGKQILQPGVWQQASVEKVLDQVIEWSAALKPLRMPSDSDFPEPANRKDSLRSA